MVVELFVKVGHMVGIINSLLEKMAERVHLSKSKNDLVWGQVV